MIYTEFGQRIHSEKAFSELVSINGSVQYLDHLSVKHISRTNSIDLFIIDNELEICILCSLLFNTGRR